MSVDRVEIYADFACPFSYVTEAGLWRMAEEGRIRLEPRALELYPTPTALPRPETPAEWEEALRPMAEAVGVEISAQPHQPRTRKAHEAYFFARERGFGAEMRRSIYEAYWRDGREIGRIDVLVELARGYDVDPAEMKIALDIDRYVEHVMQDLESARRRGIESIPTVLVEKGDTATGYVGALSLAQLASLIAGDDQHGREP